tara:strand:+ start:10367 stop:11035 length:669 start_codon:yes stop_codon:yes gene_type:complete
MQLKGLVLTTKKIEKQTEIFKRISFYFVTYAKVVHKQFDIQYFDYIVLTSINAVDAVFTQYPQLSTRAIFVSGEKTAEHVNHFVRDTPVYYSQGDRGVSGIISLLDKYKPRGRGIWYRGERVYDSQCFSSFNISQQIVYDLEPLHQNLMKLIQQENFDLIVIRSVQQAEVVEQWIGDLLKTFPVVAMSGRIATFLKAKGCSNIMIENFSDLNDLASKLRLKK